MGKIRRNAESSLKKSMSLTFFITILIIAAVSGATVFLANREQQKILAGRAIIIRYPYTYSEEKGSGYTVSADESNIEWGGLSRSQSIGYYSCYAAMIIMPVIYTVCGIGGAAALFYRKKLRTPITQLQTSMERIRDNDLDFEIKYDSPDELGQLCSSMEKMRAELRKNYRALWESLEQRKFLNASVAHDIRTPVTVLHGYLDYMKSCRLTDKELAQTVCEMNGAVTRLENYARCVSDVNRIENIQPDLKVYSTEDLMREIKNNINKLTHDKNVLFTQSVSAKEISADKCILFRIIENLVSNALRYADRSVSIDISQDAGMLEVTVMDDGAGFSDEALEKASVMFYSSEKNEEHFGIGLGICRLLCLKQSGYLKISNNKDRGACVKAAVKFDADQFSQC